MPQPGDRLSLGQLIDHGELDLLFAKRSPGRTGDTPLGSTPLGSTPLWRDRFVWVTGPELPVLGPGDVVPLVSYPPPSLSRAAAIAALERRGRPWRMACTSDSLNGLRAAALAGLGVLPHAAPWCRPAWCRPAWSRCPPGPGCPSWTASTSC